MRQMTNDAASFFAIQRELIPIDSIDATRNQHPGFTYATLEATGGLLEERLTPGRSSCGLQFLSAPHCRRGGAHPPTPLVGVRGSPASGVLEGHGLIPSWKDHSKQC